MRRSTIRKTTFSTASLCLVNTENDQTLYLCSEEYPWPGLPIQCVVSRFLSVGGIPDKAAVIEALSPAYNQGATNFVVLAKGSSSFAEALTGEIVGVYIMDVDSRIGAESYDLSNGLQPVLDWGAITSSADAAARWQVK